MRSSLMCLAFSAASFFLRAHSFASDDASCELMRPRRSVDVLAEDMLHAWVSGKTDLLP